MKHKLLFPAFLIVLLSVFACSFKQADRSVQHGLWPPLEPYQTGYLKVSDIHELYYEVSGNPEGKPVIVLHGGPGGSCRPVMRQFFNPDKFMIVLFDQRGAGRSKPFAELEGNNTWELVEDIETLRKHLNIDRMMIQGGSWGTTLALAYAETYPDRVTDLVLRGVFTATDMEIDHFYHGGVQPIFPDAWEEFMDALPDPDRRPLPAYLLELLTSDDPDVRHRIADAWLRYEWRISDVHVDTAAITQWARSHDSYAFSLIENYYMANHCFLQENQLWNNLDKIKHIPTSIVNGRFDIPCRPITAYRLHKSMPGSKLIIVEAEGHGGQAVMEAVANAVRDHEPN